MREFSAYRDRSDASRRNNNAHRSHGLEPLSVIRIHAIRGNPVCRHRAAGREHRGVADPDPHSTTHELRTSHRLPTRSPGVSGGGDAGNADGCTWMATSRTPASLGVKFIITAPRPAGSNLFSLCGATKKNSEPTRSLHSIPANLTMFRINPEILRGLPALNLCLKTRRSSKSIDDDDANPL